MNIALTGWISLSGNWTIALSVNFGRENQFHLKKYSNACSKIGVALFIVAAAQIYHPEWDIQPYQVVLVFWGVTLSTMLVCMFGNDFLPLIDVSAGTMVLSSTIRFMNTD